MATCFHGTQLLPNFNSDVLRMYLLIEVFMQIAKLKIGVHPIHSLGPSLKNALQNKFHESKKSVIRPSLPEYLCKALMLSTHVGRRID
jgi:hypothetical protein